MSHQGVVIVGIPIPSSSPVFLSVLAVHVAAGLACVIAGAIAALSRKRAGRHPFAGTIYFWSLVVVVASMAVLSVMRWPHDIHLLVLGILAFLAGVTGREARRRIWTQWARIHVLGMGASYIILLTAFYVDNGPHLPVWKHLPPWTYWLTPGLVGFPLVVRALVRHPLVRSAATSSRPETVA